MFKAIAQWLCPSSKKIADMAAEKIQESYNGIDAAKRETVSAYAQKAQTVAKYGEELNAMLTDGKIDDIEKGVLAERLATLIEAAKQIVFASLLLCACLFAGCKTYYENAGMRVRAGSVTAPVEVSEPTSSVNVRLLFFLDGVDLYAAKGYTVEMDYAKTNGSTWLSPAVTQGVHVVVRPVAATTNLCDTARSPSR